MATNFINDMPDLHISVEVSVSNSQYWSEYNDPGVGGVFGAQEVLKLRLVNALKQDVPNTNVITWEWLNERISMLTNKVVENVRQEVIRRHEEANKDAGDIPF